MISWICARLNHAIRPGPHDYCLCGRVLYVFVGSRADTLGLDEQTFAMWERRA